MRASLIVTTYNRPDALHLVLQSVLQQTVPPAEIIVADDGSTDTHARLTNKEMLGLGHGH